MQHMHQHGASDLHEFADPARNVQKMGIQHGMVVADFGAGSGAYTLAIANHLSGSGTVYAIDIQKDLLRRIRTEAGKHKYRNIELIWGDIEVPGSSKISDDTVDVVLLSNILFQVPEKMTPLNEAKRICKKKGHIVIIDWSESFGGLGPHKEDVLTMSAAKALASKCGLQLVEEFAAGAHHYGLIFSKR